MLLSPAGNQPDPDFGRNARIALAAIMWGAVIAGVIALLATLAH
jgi:hypothetical protein